jgi:hypothetical protein
MSLISVLRHLVTPAAAELLAKAVENVAERRTAGEQLNSARRVLQASAIDAAADLAFREAVKVPRKRRK